MKRNKILNSDQIKRKLERMALPSQPKEPASQFFYEWLEEHYVSLLMVGSWAFSTIEGAITRRFKRELPIEPTYIGQQIDSISDQHVVVEWSEENDSDRVILFNAKPE